MAIFSKLLKEQLFFSIGAVSIISFIAGYISKSKRNNQIALPTNLEVKCVVSSVPRSYSLNAPFSNLVTELDISGCGIDKFPDAIGNMLSLKKINAAKNKLSSLPDSFSDLKQLEVAFFLGCEFTQIPSVLGTLQNLFMLSFKANKIHDIPEDSLSSSIGWLILSDNQISSLPHSIGRLTGLRKLMLAGNKLRRLPPSIKSCTDLELVRLADNLLQQFPSELLALPRLAWLALAGNSFNSAVEREVALVQGTVDVHMDKELGSGASGVVYTGTLSEGGGAIKGTQGEIPVAVKLYRDAKTSDGCPSDEMATSAVAGATDCPHLMRSFGKLPREHPVSNGGMGLVLEFLEGYDVLGQPPSFQSVTRDQYHPTRRFSLKTILGVLRSVCGAATVLHERGITHGDMYAHNVLVKGGDNGDGFSVLSDFGASFFYKGSDSGVPISDADKLERIEVLAFGHLMSELLQRSDGCDVSEIKKIADSCCVLEVALRPSFSELRRKLLQDFERR
mmetsp:Transcript_6295/g.8133  ORF Transcript_6295/g.8133 Transcript_6295/m.8133 type:complete len:505 (+) Transcript_6295:13-1527(+)